MRLLITGGAGCLGSNLVEAYLPLGHEILVVDNFATGAREAVPEVPGLGVDSAQQIIAATYKPIEIWLTVGVLYFIMCFALGFLTRRIERATAVYRLN